MKKLEERDGSLVNNWYVACLSSELKSEPIRRIIYDRPLVLFRGPTGKATCLPDRCLHRTAQLSQGKCKDGQLSCPYHGWVYNERGAVVEIPSESQCVRDGAGPLRPNLVLKMLSVLEKDGVIWVWMGDSDPKTHPWNFPFAEDPTWIKYFMVTDFENEVTNLAENFMDVPHTVFVHKGWFRTQEKKKVPMSIEVKDGRVLVTYSQPEDSIGFSSLILNPKKEPMTHTDCFIFPNVTRVDYSFGSSSAFIINSQCTPVSTMKTRVYTYICYRMGFIGNLIKPLMKLYTRKVIQQDVDIMKNQGDNLMSFLDAKFNSTEADEVHMAIEQLRSMGIKGDTDLWKVEKQRGREFWI